MLLLLEPICMY